MPGIYEHHHTIRADEIDDLGHANNVAYVHWMQAAAMDHSRAQGWPHEAYVALGAGWVVRAHRIEYLRPAFCGDAIVVRTWVATMHKATSTRHYEIIRRADAAQLAKAETDWVFVKFDTGLPARIHSMVRAAFEIVADDTSQGS